MHLRNHHSSCSCCFLMVVFSLVVFSLFFFFLLFLILFLFFSPLSSLNELSHTYPCTYLEQWQECACKYQTSLSILYIEMWFHSYGICNIETPRLLKDKRSMDSSFNQFLELKRGAAMHTLESLMLLPVSKQRLFSYISSTYCWCVYNISLCKYISLLYLFLHATTILCGVLIGTMRLLE